MNASRPEAAFYCMSSAAYFLGAVGMINSLRIQGHDEPVYVLDLGLTAAQRELLAPEATVVEAPAGIQPWLAKTIAPLAHPAEAMVLIDTDIVVCRPLGELVDRARKGHVTAFRNDPDRFDERWADELELPRLERRPYVSSGLVALGGETGLEVLRLMSDRQQRVEWSRSWFGSDEPGYPFRYLDQDVLNAVVQSRVPADRFDALDARLAAVTPFGGLEPVDERTLRCAYPDGVEPWIVHFILPAKPWQKPMYHGVYSRLLQRTLVGPGLAIELPREVVPLRFRDGAGGRLARARIHARDRLGWRARAIVPDALLGKLDESRRRRAVKPR